MPKLFIDLLGIFICMVIYVLPYLLAALIIQFFGDSFGKFVKAEYFISLVVALFVQGYFLFTRNDWLSRNNFFGLLFLIKTGCFLFMLVSAALIKKKLTREKAVLLFYKSSLADDLYNNPYSPENMPELLAVHYVATILVFNLFGIAGLVDVISLMLRK